MALFRNLLLATGVSIASSSALLASTLTITATQANDGTVLFTGSGTLDLSEAGDRNSGYIDPSLPLSSAGIGWFWGVSGNYDVFVGANVPQVASFTPLNANGYSWDKSFGFNQVTGDNFGLQVPHTTCETCTALFLPSGYQSGDAISFSWKAETGFDFLQLNFGTIAEFGENSVTLVDGRTPVVPLPPAIAMMIAGLGGLGLLARRKKLVDA